MAMSLPRGFVQDFAYILVAKSRELTTMKVTESYNCSNGMSLKYINSSSKELTFLDGNHYEMNIPV
jgi:hypothetical protein